VRSAEGALQFPDNSDTDNCCQFVLENYVGTVVMLHVVVVRNVLNYCGTTVFQVLTLFIMLFITCCFMVMFSDNTNLTVDNQPKRERMRLFRDCILRVLTVQNIIETYVSYLQPLLRVAAYG
jgi:hypothetical protein